jgi:hypothetical protein
MDKKSCTHWKMVYPITIPLFPHQVKVQRVLRSEVYQEMTDAITGGRGEFFGSNVEALDGPKMSKF